MEFDIRPVGPTEIPSLLELIRELARFERLEHEVVATIDSLKGSLLGPRPVAGALLAHCGGELAGYALYYFTFSSFIGRAGIWLEDVYVRPDFRRHGLGRRLIEAVAQIGVQHNCGRYEWTALNWNESALQFYRNLGAHTRPEWVLLRMDSSDLKKLGSAGTNPSAP